MEERRNRALFICVTRTGRDRVVPSAEGKRRQSADQWDLSSEGRQDAVRKAQELVSKMKEDAEGERRRQIDAVGNGSAALLTSKSAQIERATGRVLDMITGED